MGGFDSFMTKAGRLGNKVADAAVNGLKWGQKAAGNVVKYGTKGLDVAKHATEAVERTPFVGTAAAPVTGALRSAIGIVVISLPKSPASKDHTLIVMSPDPEYNLLS